MTTFSGSRSRTCLYWLNYSLSCGSELGCFVDVYVSAVDLGFGFCEYKCIGARAAVGAFATLSSETFVFGVGALIWTALNSSLVRTPFCEEAVLPRPHDKDEAQMQIMNAL